MANEPVILDVKNLSGLGGTREGSSVFFVLDTGVSTTWRPTTNIIVRGVRGTANSFSVTKNGMTWLNVNALASLSVLAGGQIIFYRENNGNEPASFQGEIYVPVLGWTGGAGEEITVSNGSAAGIRITLYYDIST